MTQEEITIEELAYLLSDPSYDRHDKSHNQEEGEEN